MNTNYYHNPDDDYIDRSGCAPIAWICIAIFVAAVVASIIYLFT